MGKRGTEYARTERDLYLTPNRVIAALAEQRRARAAPICNAWQRCTRLTRKNSNRRLERQVARKEREPLERQLDFQDIWDERQSQPRPPHRSKEQL